MELFIKVYFGLAILAIVLRVLFLGFISYPREQTKGGDVIALIIGISFLIWAACLLW